MNNKHSMDLDDEIDFDQLEFKAVNPGLGFHKKMQGPASQENKITKKASPPPFFPTAPSAHKIVSNPDRLPSSSPTMGFVRSSLPEQQHNPNTQNSFPSSLQKPTGKYLDLKGLQQPISTVHIPQKESSEGPLRVEVQNVVEAKKWQVCLAWSIDLLLLLAVAFVFYLALMTTFKALLGPELPQSIGIQYTAWFVGILFVFTMSILLKSQSLGMFILQLQVISKEKEKEVTLYQSFLRLAGLIFSTASFGLFGLTGLISKLSATDIIVKRSEN
jgi:uncharacterized RDD family membrane protein YckC